MILLPSPSPSLRTRAENFSGDGSMCGNGLEVSAISSMSKNTEPGMCWFSNSALGSRFCAGRKNEPSTMRTSGASRWEASHSVLTRASGRAYVIVLFLRSDESRQRDDEPPVHLAFVLDLDAFDPADLAGTRHVRAAAGLQIDAFDRQQADATLTHGRAHAHGLDQL